MTVFPFFAHTVPCSRPASAAEYDGFGNVISPAVPELTFDAVFVAPQSLTGSRIVDGVLQETTVTKPALYVESWPEVVSGDAIVVDGELGWQVDGDPAAYVHPWTGWRPPLVIELRRAVG